MHLPYSLIKMLKWQASKILGMELSLNFVVLHVPLPSFTLLQYVYLYIFGGDMFEVRDKRTKSMMARPYIK